MGSLESPLPHGPSLRGKLSWPCILGFGTDGETHQNTCRGFSHSTKLLWCILTGRILRQTKGCFSICLFTCGLVPFSYHFGDACHQLAEFGSPVGEWDADQLIKHCNFTFFAGIGPIALEEELVRGWHLPRRTLDAR